VLRERGLREQDQKRLPRSVRDLRSSLAMRDAPNDAADKLAWRWLAGAATALEELGDPAAGVPRRRAEARGDASR
jgi:hypothetical protein